MYNDNKRLEREANTLNAELRRLTGEIDIKKKFADDLLETTSKRARMI